MYVGDVTVDETLLASAFAWNCRHTVTIVLIARCIVGPRCAVSQQVSATGGHQPQPQFQDFISRVFDNSANALELSHNDCHSSTAVSVTSNSYHHTPCATTAKWDNKISAHKTQRKLAIFIGSQTIIGTAYFNKEGRRLICVGVQLYIADFVSTLGYTSNRRPGSTCKANVVDACAKMEQQQLRHFRFNQDSLRSWRCSS